MNNLWNYGEGKMERLTMEYCGDYVPRELCSIDRLGGADDCDLCCEYCKATEDCTECVIGKCFNKLGEYEDLEEQGKLLKLRCAVGDTVYVKMQFGGYAEAEVRGFTYFLTWGFCIVVTSKSFDKQNIPLSEFGKTVFLTKEEARLEDMKNGINE